MTLVHDRLETSQQKERSVAARRGSANRGASASRASGDVNLFRRLNEEIARAADGFGAEVLDLVCECADRRCVALLPVPRREFEAVRALSTRFLVRPDHIGRDKTVVRQTADYVIAEAQERR